MDHNDINLDLLLQETLAMSEYLSTSSVHKTKPEKTAQVSMFNFEEDADYLMDLADELASPIEETLEDRESDQILPELETVVYPDTPGIIYKIDNGASTFCVRGYSTHSIKNSFQELENKESSKRLILKLGQEDSSQVAFFQTRTFELAEAVREQIVNRRFPHQEDAVCNLSDPGFSWWMNIEESYENNIRQGKFEIFFKSHGINRAEKYIQLGPIGDSSIAALRMNQARTLLRSSFPISEFSCDEKSFTIASQKPDHPGFVSFRDIFLNGINLTDLENFPDNSIGRTLCYYFHELAIVRKFWIEVKTKLG